MNDIGLNIVHVFIEGFICFGFDSNGRYYGKKFVFSKLKLITFY